MTAFPIFRGRFFGYGIFNFGFCIDETNVRVRAEQLRTRMAMYPCLVLSQVAIEPLFVWMLWGHASHQLLLLWLVVIYALHLVELSSWALHRDKLNTLQECRDWNAYFTAFSLAAGLLWGAATVIFFPSDIGYESLLICVMLGLVAGAVTMNPVHPPALYVYLFGIMIPLIVRVSLENDMLHWILVLMLSVYVAVVVLAGRGLNKTFVLSLQQRFENLALLQELSAQQAETEEARDQLEKANAELREHEEKLDQLVQQRTSQLLQRTEEMGEIKEATIIALSSLAETRDNETGNHIRRTQRYVRLLAISLQRHPRFKAFLTEENIDMLYKLAPLHDVGKVGIPDHILRKPGKLTKEEFEIMKTHAELGGNAIAIAEKEVNNRSHFLRIARQIAVGHHEKWDGSGYPYGLRGDDIPIPARLMALADVYDAMSSRRVYKDALNHDEVAAIIIEAKGKHFDPDIADAFMEIQNAFAEIAAEFRDEFSNAPLLKIVA